MPSRATARSRIRFANGGDADSIRVKIEFPDWVQVDGSSMPALQMQVERSSR
jgi:hypothetical protein